MKRLHTLALCLVLMPMPAYAQATLNNPYSCPLPDGAVIATADPLASGGWTTGGAFDDRRAVGIDAQRNRVMAPHAGLDLVAASGMPVTAMQAGRVAAVATWTHLGRTVVLEHGGATYSVYAYLGGTDVVEGATVASGARIGSAGFSGDADVVRRGNPDAAARVHVALIDGRRAGLAGAGQPLRLLGSAIDAWPAAMDSVATAINPTTRLPARCWRSTDPTSEPPAPDQTGNDEMTDVPSRHEADAGAWQHTARIPTWKGDHDETP
jgi:murein DD-endopeptidase MepM/ murein hydrolase activator NlpD